MILMRTIGDQIAELKPWWEDISIDGVRTKSIDKSAGRNKELLFKNLFDKKFDRDFFRGKRVIDLGCNAGGSTVQMLNRGASFVTCVEGNELYYRQLQLVVNNTFDYSKKTNMIKYYLSNRTEAELSNALGNHDIGLCIGLIYHMKWNDAVSLMRYMFHETRRAIFSSPITPTGRSTNWEVSYTGIDKLLEEVGFTEKVVLLDAQKGEEDWSWMTNTYYFEALR